MKNLAAEIKTRHLKFADLPSGQFEMLSAEEHEIIIKALMPLIVTEEMISAGVAAIQEIGAMNRQGVEACLKAVLFTSDFQGRFFTSEV